MQFLAHVIVKNLWVRRVSWQRKDFLAKPYMNDRLARYDDKSIETLSMQFKLGYWRWYRYSIQIDLFVMYQEHLNASFIRSYLVARHPVYVRFSDSLYNADIYVNENAHLQLREALPSSVATENKQVIVIQNAVTECCVVCQSVSLYSLPINDGNRCAEEITHRA